MVKNPTAYVKSFEYGADFFINPNFPMESHTFGLNSLIGFINQDSNRTIINNIDYLKQPHNRPANFEMIATLLWQAKLSCFDAKDNPTFPTTFIKECKWKGITIDCAAIFRKSITDQGVCCSFNRETADKIFTQSTYSELITKLQQDDYSQALKNATLPDWYINNGEPKTSSGNNMGLTVVLDGHTNYMGTFSLDSDFEGYSVFIGQPSDFPLIRQTSIPVVPGLNNLVALSGNI